MKKFTIFTLILTVVVIVVVSEIVVNEYLPTFDGEGAASLEFSLPDSLDLSRTMATNVLNDGLVNRLGADAEPVLEEIPLEYVDGGIISPPTLPEASSSGATDFEDENFVAASANVYLRDEQIKSAGFTGAHLENEPYEDNLFKTIYIGDLYDTEVSKSVIRTETDLLAKVYIFKIGINSDVDEVYQLLKVRAASGLDTQVNETSDYGNYSFFMNDSRRSGTAFLTVRVGAFIYAFSYPKEYHPQIKNLIQLLEWELG